jgi:hypothetical protein
MSSDVPYLADFPSRTMKPPFIVKQLVIICLRPLMRNEKVALLSAFAIIWGPYHFDYEDYYAPKTHSTDAS